jgi:ankyrin repeat protein
VTVLLASGADVNARDLQEGTALLRAAGSFGNAQIVEALIEAGADVNAADKNGQTALMWAARWGDSSRVKALIAAGANANNRDSNGMTALDYARNRRGEGTEELIALIEPQVDPDAKQ